MTQLHYLEPLAVGFATYVFIVIAEASRERFVKTNFQLRKYC